MAAAGSGQEAALEVPGRFVGPPGFGNGGFSCGTFAGLIDGPAEVTLRRAVPLDLPLTAEPTSEGGTLISDSAGVLAEAAPIDGLDDLEPPVRPSPEEADRFSEGSLFRTSRHIYPGCFVCGPEHPDGLGLFAGPVAGDASVCAATLHPGPTVPAADGALDSRVVWAALDCPTCTASMFALDRPFLLGRLSAELLAPVPSDGPTVAVGWELGREGRKLHSGGALLSPEGDLLARSRALWILLKEGG